MKSKWFRIVNAATQAEILIYSYIGMDDDGVYAKDFIKEFRELEAQHDEIDIRINSGGGSMHEGIPIYNTIKKSKAYVRIYIDGLAASMAAIIAMSGREIFMAKNARLMTHEPQNFMGGNAADFREAADIMDGYRDDIADVFASKSGKDKKYVLDNWLAVGKDKWFTAEEAIEAKLIDGVYDGAVESPTNTLSMERMVAFYQPALKDNSEFLTQPINTMKKVIAVLNLSGLVKLPETATEEYVAEAVTTMQNQLTAKEQTITQKDAEIKRLGDELKVVATKGLTDKATAMIKSAVTDKKIVAAQTENFLKLATASEEGYETVKGMLDSMKGFESIKDQLKPGAEGEIPEGKSARVVAFEQHTKDKTFYKLSEQSVSDLYEAATGKKPSASTLKNLMAK